MKPIPELQARIAAANKHGVFGTKMRSVINLANGDNPTAAVTDLDPIHLRVAGIDGEPPFGVLDTPEKNLTL